MVHVGTTTASGSRDLSTKTDGRVSKWSDLGMEVCRYVSSCRWRRVPRRHDARDPKPTEAQVARCSEAESEIASVESGRPEALGSSEGAP